MADATGAYVMPASNTSGASSLPATISQAGNSIKGILADLKAMDTTLSSIVTKVASIGGIKSGSGSSSGLGGTLSNGQPVPVFGSGHAGMPSGLGGASVAGSLGIPNGPTSQLHSNGSPIPKFAANAAAAFGLASLNSASASMPANMSQSTLFNQLSQQTGQSFGNNGTAQFKGLQANFAGGYNTKDDLLAAVGDANSAGWGSAVMSKQYAGQMASFASSTNQSLAATAAGMTNSISNPAMILQARAHGINLMNKNGTPASPWSVLDQTVKGTFHGGAPTRAQINTSMSTNGYLRGALLAEGQSEAQVTADTGAVQAFFANGGVGNINANMPGLSSAQKTLMNSQNRKATSQTRVAADEWSGLSDGIKATNSGLSTFNKLLDHAGRALNLIGAVKGGSGGLAQTAGGAAANDLLTAALFKGLTGRGAGGVATKAASMLPAIGEGAGMAALGGAVGGLGAAAGTLALPIGAAMVGSAVINHYTGSVYAPDKSMRSWIANQEQAAGLLPGSGNGQGSSAGMSPAGNGGGAPSAGGPSTSGGGVSSILAFAQTFIGDPYVWGGTGQNNGYDCSGFTQAVFKHFGINLPRVTGDQVKSGVKVNPKDAQPGDLIFFFPDFSHVGIYMGNNKFINAPHTGTTIQIDAVNLASVTACRRVLKGGPAGGTVSNLDGGNTMALAAQGAASAMANILGMNSVGASVGGANSPTSSSGGGGSGSSPSGVGNTNVKGNLTRTSFANDLLSAIHEPITPANTHALIAWENAEGGNWENDAAFNPLNTTQPMPGAGNTGSQGDIKVYNSWSQGLAATAKTLENGSYGGILSALHRGTNAQAVANAVAASPWGTNSFTVPSYDKGAWNLSRDQIAKVHEGEMIVPKAQANKVRAKKGSGNGGGVTVNVYPSNTSHAEAVKFVGMLKELIDEDADFDMVGSN